MSQQSHPPESLGTVFDQTDWFTPDTLTFKVRDAHTRQQAKPKRLKQVLAGENVHLLPVSEPTFANIEAPPSVYPPKKYCDLTGLPAPYCDPRTGLRYAAAPLFPILRNLPSDTVQAYLAARGAQVTLR